tara:strand:+ start:2531 stop:3223 length:693 start_codon:yes stop_codon:yes gene_type:complete
MDTGHTPFIRVIYLKLIYYVLLIMATLEQDYTTVPGQLFACLSVVGPECPQKTDKFGIKIRGCFATNAEAAAHAARLQKEDATFDIYVVDMYKWLLIPPDREQIEDTHYADDKLEELMQEYKKNQSQGKRMFEERKRDMMAVKEEGTDTPFMKAGDDSSQYYTKPDEAPLSHPAEVLEDLKKEFPDKPIEELVKMADEKVAEEIEDRRKQREAEEAAAKEADAKEIEEAE